MHGHGPRYSLVENFLDELAAGEIINQHFYSLYASTRSMKYTKGDMAAI